MARTRNPHAAAVKSWETRRRNATVQQATHDYAGPERARAVAEAKLNELRAHQSSRKDERAVAINMRTGAVLYDATGTEHPGELGAHASVDVVSAMGERGLVERLDAEPKSILEMHTHPDDGSFSDGDWASFAWSQLGESRVITKDAVYSIRKTAEWDTVPVRKRTPRALRDRWNELVDEYSSGRDWTVKGVTVRASRQMAKELGVSFTILRR